MPSNPDAHGTSGAVSRPPPKPNQKLVSIVLKSLAMTLLTSLFLLFLGVAALLLLFLAAASLRRRRSRSRSRPSPRAALRSLPQFRFPSSAAAEPADCAVCLDSLRCGQWCRSLGSCGHAFHRRCVDAWLVRVPACPVCRARVRLDSADGAGDPFEGSEDEAKWWWGSRVW